MPGEEVSYMKSVILSRLNGDHVRLSRHDVESEHIYPEDFEARHHSPYLSDARTIQVDIWLSQALNARRAPTTLDLEAEHYGIGERLLFFLKDQNDDGTFHLRHLGLNETTFHELLELPGALEAFNDNTALECLTLYGCIGAQRYDSLVKLLAARSTPLALGIEYRDWVDESSAAYATLRNRDGSFCLVHLGLPSYSLKAFLQMPGVTELLKSNTNLTSLRIRNYISENLWTSLSHFPHLTNLDLAVTSCDTGEMAPLQSLLEAQKPDGSPCLTRLGIPADALNALIHNSSLGHLRVYGTLGHRACEALSHFPLITHLDLSQADFFILNDLKTLRSSFKDMTSLIWLRAPTPLHKREIFECRGYFSKSVCAHYKELETIEVRHAKKKRFLLEHPVIHLRDHESVLTQITP